MIIIKALLTGLVCVTLCVADISGIVTDMGTTPITGAVVQLEKGGQTVTTGADGSFTLAVSSAVLHGKSTSIPNGLSAEITGNLMIVTISEQSAVEAAIFDLNGKLLSTVRKNLDAGSHSLSLPYWGAGFYLYKVKSGNREIVLKGNTMGGVSSGGAVLSQGLSPTLLAKQAMSTAAINDIILATKIGYLNYRVVAYNSDTSGIVIKMIVSAGTVKDVGGNVYQTVKIGNQVWSAENLRAMRYNDGTQIEFDTSKATWSNATTAKCCYNNNSTNIDSILKYGALYNWHAINTKKLAPVGWHIPSREEWDTLKKYLTDNGYNWDGTNDYNKIAKSMADRTDWTYYKDIGRVGNDISSNNKSGFSGLPGGYRSEFGNYNSKGGIGYWYSTTEVDSLNAYSIGLNCVYYFTDDVEYLKSVGLSVRIIKNTK